jgi:exosortase
MTDGMAELRPNSRTAWTGIPFSLPKLDWIVAALTSVAFVLLFFEPARLLVRDWWSLPEASHGLLLAPVAVWLAWRSGLSSEAAPQPLLGAAVLLFAVALRYASGLAAELFTMRVSIVIAFAGLTIYFAGTRQLRRWWLPFLLFSLAIPLPELITQTLALPLQFKASQLGAALMRMRHVPVMLTGNVIHLPGHDLFVTEACSGLRSITALLSTAVLAGALLLQRPGVRLALVLVAVPVAVLVNGIRVFLTGFLVFFVSPAFGNGFMHMTEGWLLFLVSLGAIALFAWLGMVGERWYARRRAEHV